jgi:ferrous iron transport protein A
MSADQGMRMTAEADEHGGVQAGGVQAGGVQAAQGAPAEPGAPAGECLLTDLAPGERAAVLTVDTGGGEATARRLEDLGFTPGTVVEVMCRAPLRDPILYRLKDYEICLRRAQAAVIRTALPS